MANSLVEDIVAELSETIPDMEEEKAREVAEHLTSTDIGVRSLDRLFDVDKETLNGILPRCDAQRLYRAWQTKFKPENIQRQRLLQGPESVSIYAVKWEAVPKSTMKLIKAGKRLKKKMRCELLRLIVNDVTNEIPKVKRDFFTKVAPLLVKEYPATFQDVGENASPLQCTFYDKKLKCTFDEMIRPRSKKGKNECPNIPQAYGCKKWRMVGLPRGQTTATLKELQASMVDTFQNTRRRDWDTSEIDRSMSLTYKLQREDINSQTPRVRRRAAGEGQQEQAPVMKTTESIIQDWPFLFQPRGMEIHFDILTEVNFFEKLESFEEKYNPSDFIKYLVNADKEGECKTIRKKYTRAIKNDCADAHTIATCLMLISNFKEKQNQLLLEVEKTTRIDELVETVALPPTPCIISLGHVFEAKKFYFTVDSRPASTVRNFTHGLGLLFQSYYVLNLKYAPKLGNTMEFYQREVAGINPDKGTKQSKKNYRCKEGDRVQTLLEKYALWLQEQEELEETEEID